MVGCLMKRKTAGAALSNIAFLRRSGLRVDHPRETGAQRQISTGRHYASEHRSKCGYKDDLFRFRERVCEVESIPRCASKEDGCWRVDPLFRFSFPDSRDDYQREHLLNGISELVDFHNDNLFSSRSVLEDLKHTIAPLAAGLTTCAGTFDAGVRVESSSNTG